MTALSWIAMLLLAFVGADVSDARDDIRGDPCPTGQHSWFAVDDGDYHKDWYAWERCLLGNNAFTSSKHKISKQEARDLLDEIWAEYLPWMRGRIGGSFEPPKPTLHFGPTNVRRYCGGAENLLGCSAPRGSWTEADRIVIRTTTRTLLMHEVAHSINDYRYWTADNTISKAELRRTGGHNLDFRCQVLAIYDDQDLVPAVAMDVLGRVCEFAGDDSRNSEIHESGPSAVTVSGSGNKVEFATLGVGRWTMTAIVTGNQLPFRYSSGYSQQYFSVDLDDPTGDGCAYESARAVDGAATLTDVFTIGGDSWTACAPGEFSVKVDAVGDWMVTFERRVASSASS